MISYQRDRFVDTSDLTFPYLDDISGTLRGYRVFTACRTVNNKVFRLEDHLDRLYNSARGIHMQPPVQRDGLRELVQELLQKNFEVKPGADLDIEIIFSGGLDGRTMKQSGKGAHLYIAVHLLEQPPLELYEKGVALAVYPHQRPWAGIKLLNYVGAIVGNQVVVPEQDAYDVLFVDPADRNTILEGSTFTVFFVDFDERIVTPPLDGKILSSITRKVLLELLGAREGFTVREADVRLDQVSSFYEGFLASTTRNVIPVTRIDRQIIGEGKPGPVTRSVMKALDDYMASY